MKNFSQITENLDVANKKYVDDGLSTKANKADLATVATSGSYNDLANKPTNYVTTNTEQTITSKKTFNGEVKFGSTENFQGYYIKRMLGSLGIGTRYENLDSKYKDGTYHRMWRLRFLSGSSFWGKIKVTLYGDYSSFNASGLMSKSITCNFNTSNIYNNVGCYDGLGVNVEQDFRISEAIWNATANAWEVLIWQKNLSGNNPATIMLECWTKNNTNYIKAFNGIAAQPVELTQMTSYSAQKASPTGGTKTVEWATLPVYENPLGEEIATMSDLSTKANLSGGNVFQGKQKFENIMLTSEISSVLPHRVFSNSDDMLAYTENPGNTYKYTSQTAIAFIANTDAKNRTAFVDGRIDNKKNGTKYELTLPTKTGTLALTSDIPTVNNGTLTIQKNGTTVQTFSANQSGNVTANITVPTVNNGTLTIQKNGTEVATFTANSALNTTANIKVPSTFDDLSRIKKQAYAGNNNAVKYFKLATFPVYNSDGNYASFIITGRMGGWESGNTSFVNMILYNRNGEGGGYINVANSSFFNLCDIVMYREADGTSTAYIKVKGYYTFDINVNTYQATNVYTGTDVPPTGTLKWTASANADRLAVSGGKVYVNGFMMPKQVRINDTVRNPDANAVIDLGTVPASYTTSSLTPSQCTKNGFYYVISSTNSLTDADGNPFLQYHTSDKDFRILVTAYSDSWVQQIATDLRTNHIFYRIRNNGTWGAWQKMMNAEEFTLSGTTLTITM